MGRPDIEVRTKVRAEELRFGKVPKTKSSWEWDPSHDHESHWNVERENVPAEPEEGVTYRDVEVRWNVDQRIVHPTDPDEEPTDSGEEPG
jgi:hypothetical protein